jgi:hypothetical protein
VRCLFSFPEQSSFCNISISKSGKQSEPNKITKARLLFRLILCVGKTEGGNTDELKLQRAQQDWSGDDVTWG